MLLDAREVTAGAELTYDVAVIGAGPAGIAIVDALRSTGRSVCLLEGGGVDPELRTQRLFRGESVGRPYWPLDRCRFRLLGGSSTRWGGWCRWLDDLDLAARDWVGHSGWPIRLAELAPYYGVAERLLGLPDGSFELADWAGVIPDPPPMGGPELVPELIRHSPKTDFGSRFVDQFTAADAVTLLLHANVVELRLDPGTDRIGRAEVRMLNGHGFSVRAGLFVLATGGIENARLLLASRSDRPAGIGNDHDLVGRYFMEHLHIAVGHVAGSGGRPHPFFQQRRYGDAELHGYLAPSAEAMRARRLPNCSISVTDVAYSIGEAPLLDHSPLLMTWPSAAFRRLERTQPPLALALRMAIRAAWGAGRRLQTASRSRSARRRANVDQLRLWSLYVRAEQTPNPDSRVTLDQQRDALGIPLARLDYRVNDADFTAILDWLQVLDAALRRTGEGSVVMPAEGWERGIVGGPHHMGTTRMAARPQDGVVDQDCRVHGVENLFVAGSSVFTTGGYANPTLTLLALALRLAEHLRGELASPAFALHSDGAAAPSR